MTIAILDIIGAAEVQAASHTTGYLRCDCERVGCHAGDCPATPVYRVEAFGIRYRTCANCLHKAQLEAYRGDIR